MRWLTRFAALCASTPLAHVPPVLVSHPNGALVAAAVGVLLIYLECNRPGRVLPGAAGLLLLLLGLYGMRGVSPRPEALVVIGISWLVLALPLRHPAAAWASLGAGTALLGFGLVALPRPPTALSRPLAVCCALLVGPVSAWLAAVAGWARRAKRQTVGTEDPAHRCATIEHWE